MNYHDIKVLHIFTVLAFFMSMTVAMYQPEKKLHKILSHIIGLFIIVSGVILLERFGITHKGPFPLWVLIKVGIWLALVIIPPIVFKRFTRFSKALYLPWTIVGFVAIAMAVYKPL